MARCGCSGTGCSCSIEAGFAAGCLSINVEGSGSLEDPYLISALIDPSENNLLTCSSDGLFVNETLISNTHDGVGPGSTFIELSINSPTSNGANSIGMGFGSIAEGVSAVAIGTTAQANFEGAIAIGEIPIADQDFTIAIGGNAQALSLSSTAIGTNSASNGESAISIGSSSGASAENSIAIGVGASAGNLSSVAIGAFATTTADNQIRLGTAAESVSIPGFTKAEKQIYPATDALAAQTASGLLAGTGVPSNANGNNGDFYFRSDGTVAGNTVMYHKEAGTWVAF